MANKACLAGVRYPEIIGLTIQRAERGRRSAQEVSPSKVEGFPYGCIIRGWQLS